MSTTFGDRTIVFDYGEVISTLPSVGDRAEILALADAPAEAFWAAYWKYRPQLDVADLTVSGYWHAIAAELGLEWDALRIHQLHLADFRSWLVVDQPTLEILLELQAGGARLALLSNAGKDFSSYYRYGMLGDLFEQVFTSAELGVLKPQPDIFRAVLAGLAAEPSTVVFVDNLQTNVDAANELGILGHLYTDASELREFLEAQGLLTARAGVASSSQC